MDSNDKDHLSLNACVILAAYVLFQAKEHVNGCGGESHITILRNDGISGRVDSQRIEAITKLLKYADQEIGEVLLQVPDFTIDQKRFKEFMSANMDLLNVLRNSRKKEIQDSIATLTAVTKLLAGPDYKVEPLDMFGIPMP